MKQFIILCSFFLLLVTCVFAQEQRVVIEESYVVEDNVQINLEVDGGIVIVERHDEDYVWVSLKYSEKNSRGDIRFNERKNELDIKFDFKNWKVWKNTNGQESAKLIVRLPEKPFINIKSRIKAGEIKYDVGGLRIKNFDLINWAGQVDVDFFQPNKIPMETFDVNVKVGELTLRNLGNANFKEADINGGIGEMTVDFTGERIHRTMAKIDLDIGETSVIIPESVGTKIKVSSLSFLSQINFPTRFSKKGKYLYSENYNTAENSLYLVISSGIGELDITVK